MDEFTVHSSPPHQCELPNPAGYPLHTVIECQGHTIKSGRPASCGRQWRNRMKGVFRKRLVWEEEDYGW